MEDITYINFCRTMFIFSLFFIIFMIILFALELKRKHRIDNIIENDLENLWNTLSNTYEDIPEDKIRIIMLMEAEKLYRMHIYGNDYYMKKNFISK